MAPGVLDRHASVAGSSAGTARSAHSLLASGRPRLAAWSWSSQIASSPIRGAIARHCLRDHRQQPPGRSEQADQFRTTAESLSHTVPPTLDSPRAIPGGGTRSARASCGVQASPRYARARRPRLGPLTYSARLRSPHARVALGGDGGQRLLPQHCQSRHASRAADRRALGSGRTRRRRRPPTKSQAARDSPTRRAVQRRSAAAGRCWRRTRRRSRRATHLASVAESLVCTRRRTSGSTRSCMRLRTFLPPAGPRGSASY